MLTLRCCLRCLRRWCRLRSAASLRCSALLADTKRCLRLTGSRNALSYAAFVRMSCCSAVSASTTRFKQSILLTLYDSDANCDKCSPTFFCTPVAGGTGTSGAVVLLRSFPDCMSCCCWDLEQLCK